MGKTLVDLEKVIQILSYYEYFAHCPTLEEIWKIYPKKISIKDFEAFIKKFHSQELIGLTGKHYHILGRVCDEDLLKLKAENAKVKLSIAKSYQKIFSHIPGVVYIGLSGSVAAGYAKEADDIDIFVITKHKRLFTTRLLLLGIFAVLGKKRSKRGKNNENKFCFNMFFDEHDLVLPEAKRGIYGAFELSALRTLFDTGGGYSSFLIANDWALQIAPNAFQELIENNPNPQDKSVNSNKQGFWQNLFDFLENFTKYWQLLRIKDQQTNEIITDSQLWFHPNDVSKIFQKGK